MRMVLFGAIVATGTRRKLDPCWAADSRGPRRTARALLRPSKEGSRESAVVEEAVLQLLLLSSSAPLSLLQLTPSSFSHSNQKTLPPQGRYELVCERSHGLVPFNPSRATRVTLATPGCRPAAETEAAAMERHERGNDDDEPTPSTSTSQPLRSPRDEFLLFNVGDALHIAPLFQIDRAPWRCLVFDGRENSSNGGFVPPSSSSVLRGTTPVCHAWRPLPPALRGKEPDVIVGLAGGACVLLSLELELEKATARVRRGRGNGEEEREGNNNAHFHSSSSFSSCSSPVAAQVLWPPPPLVLGGAVRSHDGDDASVAGSVSPSLPSRVVAVGWAPRSRAVVVHACGLVAVHDPPWRLDRADEGEEEEDNEEEEEMMGDGKPEARASPLPPSPSTASPSPPSTSLGGGRGGGGEEEEEGLNDNDDVNVSSPASSSFMTAAGTTTAGSSPPGGVGNSLGASPSPAAAAGLSAAAAAHATTPPTPPTPPSRRMTPQQQHFEEESISEQRGEQQQRFARPAVRTFSVVADLDEEEEQQQGGEQRGGANGSRRRKSKKTKMKKKSKKAVVSRSSIVAAAALSPDGTLIATAGRDGVARVHSLETGRLVAGFSAYYGALHAVAWCVFLIEFFFEGAETGKREEKNSKLTLLPLSTLYSLSQNRKQVPRRRRDRCRR